MLPHRQPTVILILTTLHFHSSQVIYLWGVFLRRAVFCVWSALWQKATLIEMWVWYWKEYR